MQTRQLVVWGSMCCLALGGCDGVEPTAPVAPLRPAFDLECPELPCRPPTHDELDKIYTAILNLDADGAFGQCLWIKEAALAAYDDNLIWIGPSHGDSTVPAANYWVGDHPTDNWLFNSLDDEMLMWPPLYTEMVITHEFAHVAFHLHKSLGQEPDATAYNDECLPY